MLIIKMYYIIHIQFLTNNNKIVIYDSEKINPYLLYMTGYNLLI